MAMGKVTDWDGIVAEVARCVNVISMAAGPVDLFLLH